MHDFKSETTCASPIETRGTVYRLSRFLSGHSQKNEPSQWFDVQLEVYELKIRNRALVRPELGIW